MKDKENTGVVAKNKESSSSRLSPTKKSSLKSNQSSPSKPSKSSAQVTLKKPSRSLRSSLLSKKIEQSSELASRKSQAPSKTTTVSGTKEHPIVLSSGESDLETPLHYSLRSQAKEHPIVLSSGESDHEAPLPSIRLQTRASGLKENTVKPSVEKPKATIKPFQIKKVAQEPRITQTNCLGILPNKADRVVPVKKEEPSVLPIEKQPKEPVKKVTESTVGPTKCQSIASSQKKVPLVEKQPAKQTLKAPPAIITRHLAKKAPIKRVIPPIVPPPPPPPPPRSFSYNYHHQVPYHHYQSYDYSHRSYPVGGEPSYAPSYSTHPLATSYSSASYYHYQ